MQVRAKTIRGGFPDWEREPLPWLAVALIAGVALLGPHVVQVDGIWMGCVSLLLVGALAGRRLGARIAVMLATVMLGAALGAPGPRAVPLERAALIQGVVREVSGISAVVDHPTGSVRLLFPGVVPAAGRVISARTTRVTSPPALPGEPDRQRVDRRLDRETRRVKDWVVIGPRAADSSIPDAFTAVEYGGVLWSLASGQRAALEPAHVALLRRTGTAHLLAVSGMHIGFVAGACWAIGRLLMALRVEWNPFWRWRRISASMVSLFGILSACMYASLVGWPVSARRAVWMVAGAAAATLLERPIRSWTLVAMAAMAVTIDDPDCVYGLGFGLSFGAVLGILLVTPRLLRWVPPDLPRLLAWVIDGLAVSIGAMVGTLPLTAWWFQAVSPLSPLANLVAVPMLGGVGVPAALIAAHAPERLAMMALWIGSEAIGCAMGVLSWLDRPPWTLAVGPMGAGLLVLAITARRQPVLCAGALACAIGLPELRLVDGLEVTVLAVGQGDAVFIRLPDGRRWLFDGGPPSRDVLEWLRREGHHHLDAVFLSHPDQDHLGGLVPVIESLSVGRFVTARPPRPEEHAYRALWQELYARRVPVEGADWEPDGPARLLHPSGEWLERSHTVARVGDNDASLVLMLEYEGLRFLLPGDIERSAEEWLSLLLPRVDVLLAPHHGSRTSSSDAFVVATNPDWVVVSCGPENRHGHPHAATLAQWRGRRVVRTDVHGTLRFRASRNGLSVHSWSRNGRFRAVRPWVWRPRPP